MTTMDALTAILHSCPDSGKWYNVSSDEKECTKLRVTALRILAGTCKHSTQVKFFAKFGYEQEETQWKRTDEK